LYILSSLLFLSHFFFFQAIIFAVLAASKNDSQDYENARKYIKYSYITSGVSALTVVLMGIALSIYFFLLVDRVTRDLGPAFDMPTGAPNYWN